MPFNKSFILLEGEGRLQTSIEWADHAGGSSTTADTPTFASHADDFMARDITFKVSMSPNIMVFLTTDMTARRFQP